MKILHVASFVGNIGDNASHIGLEKILNSIFDYVNVERLEIRKFYNNYTGKDRKNFDLEFINYANTFDLVLIGGGGFLDYWVEGSSTGTTIDLEPSLVGSIKTPTLICSVGCAPHKKIPLGNVEKFNRFIEAVSYNSKVRIAVRNDGSIDNLKKEVNTPYLELIPEILDNGFFFNTDLTNPLNINGNYICINITIDQLDMESQHRGLISKESYLDELRSVVYFITSNLNKKVVFVPHIPSDIKAIYQVLEALDDFTLRNSVFVAPCLQHDEGAKFIFSIYKSSDLVIGTRFHSNVCAISMGVPTIGLVALDRVKYLYDKFGLSDNYFLLDKKFSSELIKRVELLSSTKNKYLNDLEKELVKKRELTKSIYIKLFSELGFSLNVKK